MATTPTRVEFLRPDELGLDLDPDWDDLAANASEPNVFMERWFMQASVRHLAVPQSLRLAFVYADGALIGVMSLFLARRYGRMVLSHVQSWSHYHSFLGAPLVRAGYEQRFWSLLLAQLDGEDWVDGLFHINGLVEGDRVHLGLIAAAKAAGRTCDTVHRTERALLERGLDANAYYEAHIRKKKRKEIGRLRARLAELGNIEVSMARRHEKLADYTTEFLQLEQLGWKGKAGSALASTPETENFFQALINTAGEAGRAEILRLSVGDRPIAMLVNFIAMPGSFSYKIAFDEEFARFSPGVLIQLENLFQLEREGFGWMDSCAVENHPMINSLWQGRRQIVRVSLPLGGLKRGMIFRFCRTAEDSWAQVKNIKSVPRLIVPQEKNIHEPAGL